MAWIGTPDRGAAVCQPPRSFGDDVAQFLRRVRPAVEFDRRRNPRTAIPLLFELSPHPGEVAEDAVCSMVVVGKDISGRGIGLFHDRPIPYRRGVLTIDLPDQGRVRLEVELLWCRFTSLGWYESGGRLLGVSSSAGE